MAAKLVDTLKQLPELEDVARISNPVAAPSRSSSIADASRLGITPAMIDNTLYDAFGPADQHGTQ